MATPFPFQSGAVLEAAELNAITELPINDKTDSYTLVAGDAGEYVIMNAPTAKTITVPNSVFSAGQIVRIVNKGAGVCTVTAGAGTNVSTTGTLALAQYATGTILALSASAFIFEAGGVTQSASALTYITGATFTTVSSVSFAANTFSATYANYLVLVDVTSVSTTLDVLLRFRAGGTDTAGTGYWWRVTGTTPGSADSTSSIQILDNVNTTGVSYGGSAQLTIFSPQLARNTNVVGSVFSEAFAFNGVLGGSLYNTTSYDAATLLTSTGTMSGNYRVYGYANS